MQRPYLCAPNNNNINRINSRVIAFKIVNTSSTQCPSLQNNFMLNRQILWLNLISIVISGNGAAFAHATI